MSTTPLYGFSEGIEIHEYRRPGRSGFTLIELLVVVAIIAALSALLLPTIGIVRDLARSTQCASNLRMVIMATLNYTTDNGLILPYYDNATNVSWVSRTTDYLDGTYRNQSYSGNSVYHCAHAGNQIRNPRRFQDLFSFHYSMNDALCAAWFSGGWQNGKPPVPMSKVKSGRVVFADGNINLVVGQVAFKEVGVATTSGDGGPWPVGGKVILGDAAQPVPSQPAIIRHGGRVNQAHADGHVAPITGIWIVAERLAEW